VKVEKYYFAGINTFETPPDMVEGVIPLSQERKIRTEAQELVL
jgi:hypothetical protein